MVFEIKNNNVGRVEHEAENKVWNNSWIGRLIYRNTE